MQVGLIQSAEGLNRTRLSKREISRPPASWDIGLLPASDPG